MVPILEGNSYHLAQVRRKIGLFEEKSPIYDCSRSSKIPQTDKITEIAP